MRNRDGLGSRRPVQPRSSCATASVKCDQGDPRIRALDRSPETHPSASIDAHRTHPFRPLDRRAPPPPPHLDLASVGLDCPPTPLPIVCAVDSPMNRPHLCINDAAASRRRANRVAIGHDRARQLLYDRCLGTPRGWSSISLASRSVWSIPSSDRSASFVRPRYARLTALARRRARTTAADTRRSRSQFGRRPFDGVSVPVSTGACHRDGHRRTNDRPAGRSYAR